MILSNLYNLTNSFIYMKKESDLEFVKRSIKEIGLLSQTGALLNWDEETNMPKSGIEARSEQTGYIRKLAHEKFTSNDLYNKIVKLKKSKLSEEDKIMIDKLYKKISKARKIPKEYVEELSKVTTLATAAWRKAREKQDFKIFEPYLNKIVELKIKEANYIKLKGHLYNSLLDDYEEGMTVEKLKPVFNKLKADLKLIIKNIESSKEYKNKKLILVKKEFPRDIQMELVRDVVKRIGLKDESSRIDFAEHPFSSKIGFNDVRITTNIRNDPLFSFNSSMHEAGHALYDSQIPKKFDLTALDDAPSLGMHESQSKFWEVMIGQSKSFWKFYFPKFNEKFKLNGEFKQWYEEVNDINPGMIRIEGDEIHYCLHIILRFEIETGLIDGSIKVKNLPQVWNQKMKELFGVSPKNDKEGVLQDVHWSNGMIGYFPTYALGVIYSAQIYSAMQKSFDVEKELEKGDYEKIRSWLNNNIHKYGGMYLADDIIKKACSKGLDPSAFINHIKKKYSEIYGI